MHGLSEQQLSQIESITGTRPVEVLPLAGATSSDLYHLNGIGADAVLRIFLAERWEETAADLSVRELDILRALADEPVAAPGPIGTLPDNGVLMGFLPGVVHLPAMPGDKWLRTLAETLAQIHGLTVQVPYTFESWNDTTAQAMPDWWQSTSLWLEAQAQSAGPLSYEPCFIHRDYHPVNVLWESGRITGVVDWINACMGPRGIDVAHCRLNLALMYGSEAAEAFLHAYLTAAPDYRHDTCWDLEDALGALPDVAPYPPWEEFGLTGLSTELVRDRLEAFVAAAVDGRINP